MSARTKARKRAVDILFEGDQRDIALDKILAERIANPGHEIALPRYSITLVEGVKENQERIDELLETYSQDWPLERMPAVDRALLRLGSWEMLFAEDVPAGVVLAEWTELATDLSTDESPRFVNGLLDRLNQLKPTLGLDS